MSLSMIDKFQATRFCVYPVNRSRTIENVKSLLRIAPEQKPNSMAAFHGDVMDFREVSCFQGPIGTLTEYYYHCHVDTLYIFCKNGVLKVAREAATGRWMPQN